MARSRSFCLAGQCQVGRGLADIVCCSEEVKVLRPVFALRTGIENHLPLVVRGVGMEIPQTEEFRPQGFPQHHWLYSVAGSGILQIRDTELAIPEQAGFLLRPGVPHGYRPAKPWQTLWLTFDCAAPLWQALQFQDIHVMTAIPVVEVMDTAETMGRLLQRQDVQGVLEASAVLYQFLVKLHGWLADSGTGHDARGRLWPVIELMHRHFADPLSLQQLADWIGVSPHHLCRLFRTAYDTTPTRFLKRIRIRRAKELLLQEGQWSSRRVGEQVGYGEPSYFAKIFKEQEGMTPQAFRRLYRS